jgi:hydroxyquinol 1,2-dioxygenase
MIDAPGHERLTTHVFAAGDAHLASDAVFGVKETLIAPFERHDPGTAPDGRELDAEWFSMTYDFVLAPRNDAGGAA